MIKPVRSCQESFLFDNISSEFLLGLFMQYIINKIVGGVICPLGLGLLFFLIGAVLLYFKKRKWGAGVSIFAFLWFYFWSSAAGYFSIGLPLEKAYPPMKAADYPEADAIIVLGGGMNACPWELPYPEMEMAADRVWHAARLYHAGKAPLIIPSGYGEENAAVPLLVAFRVPKSAIHVEGRSKNTEENAAFVKKLIEKKKGKTTGKILLVTSAWHMRRSLLHFKMSGFDDMEVIPAACDYECTVQWGQGSRPSWYFPTMGSLNLSSMMFKEHLGYCGYWVKNLFRKKKSVRK